jgi:HEPN domain-containing protein
LWLTTNNGYKSELKWAIYFIKRSIQKGKQSMPSKTYAIEWLDRSKRNLDTAVLLVSHNHYTDVIAIDIHQTLEKAFKAVYAYYGISIPRTHTLLPLFEFVITKIEISGVTIDDILIISDYYETDRDPGPKYFLPSIEETALNLDLAKRIFNVVERHINQ